MTEQADDAPPPRYLLRPAGVLTQLLCAFALLLGTISFILVTQNKSGGVGIVIAWAVIAMTGLVFGGLMARGGLLAVIASAVVDAVFGGALLIIDWDTLRALLRLLPESDVEMIADLLVVVGVVMLATTALCLAAIPQARAYNRALRDAEAEAERSGFFQAAASAAMPQQMQVTVPTRRTAPSTVPPPPVLAPGHAFRGGAGSSLAHMPAVSDPPPHVDGPPLMPPPLELAPTAPQSPYAPRLPLPAPPPTGDGWAPAPRPVEPYVPTSASTAPGWTPAPARTTMMIVRAPAAERRSRRRVYFMLGGLAIGLGAGVGVLVSAGGDAAAPSTEHRATTKLTVTAGSADTAPIVVDAGVDAGIVAAPPVRGMLDAQRAALGKGDFGALAATYSLDAFAVGVDAEDVSEGRDLVAAMISKNLGEVPLDGWTVSSRSLAVGEVPGFAWTAEELDVTGPTISPRRFVVTQLAQFTSGAWSVVALHWARPVADATAERLAILGTLPAPRALPNRAQGDAFDKAVRAAFASRRAFADARSERADGFNFGSGPGERIVGGSKIKALFGRLRSELRIEGGVRSAQLGSVGWAMLTVGYTQKTRAATDLTQTFRVLAIFVEEAGAWRIAQTQFSHAGPISE